MYRTVSKRSACCITGRRWHIRTSPGGAKVFYQVCCTLDIFYRPGEDYEKGYFSFPAETA